MKIDLKNESFLKFLRVFRNSLLGVLVVLPLFGIVYTLFRKAEHRQQAVLSQWNRSDFALLSLSRSLYFMPLPDLLSGTPLSPLESRRLKGGMAQAQAALQELDRSRPLLEPFQIGELDHLEKLVRSLRTLLESESARSGKGYAGPDFISVLKLEQQIKLVHIVLSLSVKTSLGAAQARLERLATDQERTYGALLLAFLVGLIVIERRDLTRAHREIAAKESQLQGLFDAMTDVVVYTDIHRNIRFANPAIERMFGYRPEELTGKSAAIFYAHPEDFEKQGRQRFNPEAPTSDSSYEVFYRRKDGTQLTGECRGSRVFDQAGHLQGYMVTVRDITEQKKMMDALFREKEKWFVTLGSIGDAVITTDIHARVEYMNEVAQSLTGWGLPDASGEEVARVFDIINEVTRNPASSPIEKALRQGVVVGLANHTVLRSRSGEEYAIEDSAAPIRDSTGQIIGCVIVFRDITQKRNLLRQITRQANFDALTDLPNRYLFQDRLVQTIAQAHRYGRCVALLYLDLDHFKKINDTLGHPFGDQVLTEIGTRLGAVVRESDTVARLGGDEFTIIAGDMGNRNTAAKFAQKVLDAIAPPFSVDGQELHLTGSLGVALYPDDGDTATTLVKNADIAMYQAKEKGRNTIQFYSPEMNLVLQERISLENHLHRGLEQKEFRLVYQPILDLSLGKVIGVEALVRWHHPDQGIIPPNRFIPLAEENGLIRPLGEWVLETACGQGRKWLDDGLPPLRMMVNVSIRQLMYGDIPATVERCLSKAGLSAEFLELELTESVFMQNTEMVLNAFEALHRLGVRLSIDDFGTGYSSLSYLNQFRVHTLKIDASFIQGLRTQTTNRAIVTAILALANSMNVDVVAEGVETGEQAQFLRDHQCLFGQGFFFSPPVDPDRIPELVKKMPSARNGMSL